MNKNLEENLKQIKLKEMSEEDKNQIWSGFTFAKGEFEKNKKTLLFNLKQFMLFKKQVLAVVLSLVIILGGGGMVRASNNSVPGDVLFGLDKALEKIELSLASETKKNELKIKFAEERLQEAEEVIKESEGNNFIVKFKSEKQTKEIEASLDSVADVLADSNLTDERKAQIGATLASIMILIQSNPDLEFEVKTKDGFKVEVEDDKIEIKINNKSGSNDDEDDNSGKDDDESDDDDKDDNSGKDDDDDNSGSGSN